MKTVGELPRRGLVSNEGNYMTPRMDLPRARFTDDALVQMPMDAGILYPVHVQEIIPGDLMRWKVVGQARMSTPVVPLFSNQTVELFGWFCPTRLVHPEFELMHGSQKTGPTQSIAVTAPKVVAPAGGFARYSIYDYMGIPCQDQAPAAIQVLSYPFRAYSLIYNEFVRDQNSMEDVPLSTTSANDADTAFALKRVTAKADYFTRMLPWAQKFTAPALFPAALAPITGIGVDTNNKTASATDVNVIETSGAAALYSNQQQITNATNWYIKSLAATPDAQPQIFADLSAATGITINAFRQSMLIQTLLEKDARGGTRYIEHIREQFGVESDDARLQRPEFIGGGSFPVNVTPVAQTAPVAGVGVGVLAAAGTALGGASFSLAAKEHGYVLILAAIRTERLYQQGLHRMWSRSTRFDFPYPILSAMGEQAVLRKELYMTGVANDDNTVLGYNPQYEELRRLQSRVVGVLRSTDPTPLDVWHLGVEYSAPPVLGPTFLEDSPPMTRVLQLGSAALNQHFLAEFAIHADMTRMISAHGIPASLVRF